MTLAKCTDMLSHPSVLRKYFADKKPFIEKKNNARVIFYYKIPRTENTFLSLFFEYIKKDKNHQKNYKKPNVDIRAFTNSKNTIRWSFSLDKVKMNVNFMEFVCWKSNLCYFSNKTQPRSLRFQWVFWCPNRASYYIWLLLSVTM